MSNKISEKFRKNNSTRKDIVMCPLAFAEVGVKGRVKSVLNYKKPTVILVAIAMVLCVSIAFCFFTTPKISNESKYEIFAKGENGNILMHEYEDAYHAALAAGRGAVVALEEAKADCLGNEAFYLEAVEKGYQASEEEVSTYINELKKHYNVADNREALQQQISLYGEEAYWEREAFVREKELTVNKYREVIEAEWEEKFMDETFLSFDEYYRQYISELANEEKFEINYSNLMYETLYFRKIDLQHISNKRLFYKISNGCFYYYLYDEWVYMDFFHTFDLSEENLDDLMHKSIITSNGKEISEETLRKENKYAWFAGNGTAAFLLLEQNDGSFYIAECLTNKDNEITGYYDIMCLTVCSPDYAENLENYGELEDNIDRYIDPLTDRHSVEEINQAMEALVKYFNRNYHGDVLYEITYDHDANDSVDENEMYLMSTYELRPNVFSVNDEEEIVGHDWRWYLYKENGKWHVSMYKSGRG